MKKNIIVTILILAVIGAILLHLETTGNPISPIGKIKESLGLASGGNIIKTITLEDLKAEMEDYSPYAQIDPKTRTYTNTKYGFSFKIPKNMLVSNFQEGRRGEVILIQSRGQGGTDSAPWVQVFVLPFDETGLVDPERIHQDLSELKIQDPQYALIGKNQFKALIFWSQESSFGKTREVWFARNGYLFQITTSKAYERVLGEMLETISFEK